MDSTKDNDHVVIIAEIGVNHNGSLSSAKELIARAVEAGADYAKFQTFRSALVASSTTPVAPYQQKGFAGLNQLDLLSSYEFSEEEFLELVAYSQACGIGFLTTAHDMESARFVLGLDSDYIKIPSGDVTNYPFLRLVGKQRKPVLLSTGASTFAEVEDAVAVLESEGFPKCLLTVMQCTSEYPAPTDQANLNAMVSFRDILGTQIGFSDHTLGYQVAVIASALGASVIEKHITLDTALPGPDHAASLEPVAFAEMVNAIRNVKPTIGSGEKIVTRSEAKNRDLIRKSIVALVPIDAGEVFSQNNLGLMRPGTGLSPMAWNDILGTVANRDYEQHEMIEPS